VQYGAQDILQREYGPFIVEPESGYDFSVIVSLDDLPAEQGMLPHHPVNTRS
jgi:actin related protein 2/3 complex subunit 2